MPKWRKLWLKTLESPDFDSLPDDFTRLLWVLIPLALDREGICPDSFTWIRSRVFPLRGDVSLGMVGDAIVKLREMEMLKGYNANGRDYLWCPSFRAHQGNTHKEAESIYPLPAWLEDGQELVRSNSGVGPELVRSRSGTDTEADTEADTDSDTDVEAEADQPKAAADPFFAKASDRLAELGVDEPMRSELGARIYVTVPYINEWWAFICSWDKPEIAVPSLISRLEERRQVPPDWRGKGE